MKPLKFEYTFKNENDSWTMDIELDPQTLNILKNNEMTSALPPWTEMSFCQCSNCPFSQEDVPHCPVAVNLYNLVEKTKNMISCSRIQVTVKAKERTYYKETDLQEGLFSAMGLLMASSSCPHFDMFKPMARFHLPFSTPDETFFRIISTFLLKTYYNKGNTDKVLDDIQKHYNQIQTANTGILSRIRATAQGDADKNAIVALNIFAQLFSLELSNDFESIRKIIIRE